MRRRSSNTLEIHYIFSLKGLFLSCTTVRVKQSAVIVEVPFNCKLRFELAGGTHPVVSVLASSVTLHSADEVKKWETSDTNC